MAWIYIILNIFLLTTFSLLSRKWLKDTEENRAFAFVFNLFAFLFSLIFYLIYYIIQKPESIFLIKPESTVNTPLLILTILLAIFFWAFGERYRFTAVANIDVSISTILSTMSSVLLTLAGFIFYKDPHNIYTLIAFTLVIIANGLFIKKINLSSLHQKGLVALLIQQLGWAIALTLEPSFLGSVNILIYTLLVWGIETIIVYLAPCISKKQILNMIKAVGLYKVIFLAFLNALVYYIYLLALNKTNLSIVTIALEFVPVLVVVGGVFLLKEKEHTAHKFIAIILATVGLILLKVAGSF